MKVESKLPPESDYGSPAWEELVSKSPTLQEFAVLKRNLRDRLQEIQDALYLRQNSDILLCLEALESAGANRSIVLRGLALVLAMQERRDKRTHWLKEMRRKKRALKMLAVKTRNLATEIKETYHDPSIHPDAWAVALQIIREGPVVVEADDGLIDEMLACADDLEARAAWLGQFSKAITPAEKRNPLILLVAGVQKATTDAVPHLPTLARLLAMAYNKLRIPGTPPTTEKLYKDLTRHVLPRLK